MALTPSCGLELWQARPRVRSFQRTAPRWATITFRSVGSAMTATVGADERSEPELRRVAPQSGECFRPLSGRFFVARARNDDVGGPLRPIGDQPREGRQNRRHSPFDVAGPRPYRRPVLYGRVKRGDDHPLDRDRILMCVEQDCDRGPRPIEPGNDVGPAGEHLDALALDTEPLEKI